MRNTCLVQFVLIRETTGMRKNEPWSLGCAPSRTRVVGNMQCDTNGGITGIAEVLYVVICDYHTLVLLAVTVGNSKA